MVLCEREEKDIMNKEQKILVNGRMPKDDAVNPGYTEVLESQTESIELFIIMYGTKDLEKILNKIFVAHNIKEIKIKLNYTMGKIMGKSPIQ